MTYQEICALRSMGIDSKDIMRLGKSIKGQGFTTIQGTVETSIQIPGTAKVFMGYACVSPNENQNTLIQNTLQLNNETIVDRLDIGFSSPDDRSLQPNGYVEVTRRLTGKDVLKMTTTATAAFVLQFAFYYMSGFGEMFRKVQAISNR